MKYGLKTTSDKGARPAIIISHNAHRSLRMLHILQQFFEILANIFTRIFVFGTLKDSSNALKTYGKISLYFKRRPLII